MSFLLGKENEKFDLFFPEKQSFEQENSKIKRDMFKIWKLFMADYKEHKARYFMYLYNYRREILHYSLQYSF